MGICNVVHKKPANSKGRSPKINVKIVCNYTMHAQWQLIMMKKMSTRREEKICQKFLRAANKQKTVDIDGENNDERKLACR